MADHSASAAELEANIQDSSTKGEHGAVPHTGEDAIASTAADGGHGEVHAEPSAFGLDATGWVGLAMIAVIALMLWKRVPAAIGAALDRRIAEIREQLDEARQLRAEAEALKAEYEARSAAASRDAEAILDRARHEADAIVAQARSDSEALMARRARMAEDKIGAAERTAIAQVRARAADAATAAAASLIGQQLDRSADRAMVDQTIATLARPN